MKKISKIIFRTLIVCLLFSYLINSIYTYYNIAHNCDDEMCSICIRNNENKRNRNVLLSTYDNIILVSNEFCYEEYNILLFNETICKTLISLKVKLLN